MRGERLAMGLGGFVVAFVAVDVLMASGFDDAPVMVLASGAIAAAAVVYLRVRATFMR